LFVRLDGTRLPDTTGCSYVNVTFRAVAYAVAVAASMNTALSPGFSTQWACGAIDSPSQLGPILIATGMVKPP